MDNPKGLPPFFFPCPFLSEMGFPGGSDSKEPTCDAGDLGSIPGLGRSLGEVNGYSLQYSCLENSNGEEPGRGGSPWGGKELDKTKQLTLSLFYYFPPTNAKISESVRIHRYLYH